ncbi:MAG: glycosyltransferase [Pseudomonadota bacterium]
MSFVLQNLLFPEREICTERQLYYTLTGAVGFDRDSASMVFGDGGHAKFATYFNLFSFKKWHLDCGIDELWLRLDGTGQFEVSVYQTYTSRSWELVEHAVIDLNSDAPERLHIRPDIQEDGCDSLLFFEVNAITPGKITGGAFETDLAPTRTPELAISITTFRREEDVATTARRLGDYLSTAAFGEHIRVYVVDNGKSAEITPSAHIRVIENENLGGAGGFTRGLIEAQKDNVSHVLFMDDDANFHMENLHRTYAWLSYVKDDRAAVAGAMINNTVKYQLWENGAEFHHRCYPLYPGLDLREKFDVIKMEVASAEPKSHTFYGGWWFFAFPLAHVERYPFPFFVRGDDVSFSLAHDFKFQTLNGVVSFQDDFIEKENPLNWYLDLRSHMVHHLTIPALRSSWSGVIKIAWWFALRNIIRFQYETIDAITLAVEDVLRGPEFFETNADMAQRRADIKDLVKLEKLVPVEELGLPHQATSYKASKTPLAHLHKLTLNGHLNPFTNLLGKHKVVPAENRGEHWPIWGAKRITYLSSRYTRGYHTEFSYRKGWAALWKMVKLTLRFRRAHPKLLKQYAVGYDKLTAPDYWHAQLGLEGKTATREAAE